MIEFLHSAQLPRASWRRMENEVVETAIFMATGAVLAHIACSCFLDGRISIHPALPGWAGALGGGLLPHCAPEELKGLFLPNEASPRVAPAARPNAKGLTLPWAKKELSAEELYDRRCRRVALSAARNGSRYAPLTKAYDLATSTPSSARKKREVDPLGLDLCSPPNRRRPEPKVLKNEALFPKIEHSNPLNSCWLASLVSALAPVARLDCFKEVMKEKPYRPWTIATFLRSLAAQSAPENPWPAISDLLRQLQNQQAIDRASIEEAYDAIFPLMTLAQENGGPGTFQDPCEPATHLFDRLPSERQRQIGFHGKISITLVPNEIKPVGLEELELDQLSTVELDALPPLGESFEYTKPESPAPIFQIPLKNSIQEGVEQAVRESGEGLKLYIKVGEQYYLADCNIQAQRYVWDAPPDLLPIQIQRYSIHGNYLNNKVTVSPRLTLPESCFEDGNPHTYIPVSATRYSYGHHTALVRWNNLWFQMDDLTTPRPLGLFPEKELETSYLLFYVRQSTWTRRQGA